MQNIRETSNPYVVPDPDATSNGTITANVDATAQASPDTSVKPLPRNDRRMIDRAGITMNKGKGQNKARRMMVKASRRQNRKWR